VKEIGTPDMARRMSKCVAVRGETGQKSIETTDATRLIIAGAETCPKIQQVVKRTFH
jgi:hypothetical protein